MYNKNFCFTLSEVLITLVIIGVVSAIAVPVLSNYTSSLEYKSKLKKTYSTLLQAFRLTYGYDYDDFRDWKYVHSASFTQEVYQKLSKYLYIEKLCGVQEAALECWADKTYAKNGKYAMWFTDDGKHISSSNSRILGFVLNDGTSVYLDVWNNSNCEMVGVYNNFIIDGGSSLTFLVDVNGLKKPNTLGKDIYAFVLTTKGIVPAGTDNNSQNCHKRSTNNNFDCAAEMLVK